MPGFECFIVPEGTNCALRNGERLHSLRDAGGFDRGCHGCRSRSPQMWFLHGGVRALSARGLGEPMYLKHINRVGLISPQTEH